MNKNHKKFRTNQFMGNSVQQTKNERVEYKIPLEFINEIPFLEYECQLDQPHQ